MLKQRLVGTAVLIVLAVIFIPMALDGPVDRAESTKTSSIPLVLPEPEPVSDPQPADTPPQPPPQQPVVQRPVTQPTAPAVPAPVEAGWAVQLGAFSDRARAEALAEQVKARGFDVIVQRAVMDNGTMYRVRVGPVAERAVAEALADRIQRTTGERGAVVAHP